MPRYEMESLRFRAEDWNGPYYRPVMGAHWCGVEPMRNDLFLNATEPQAHFILTLRGGGTFKMGDESHRLTPGRAITFHTPNRGTLTAPGRGQPWELLWLCFGDEMAMEFTDKIARQWGWLHDLDPASPPARAALSLIRAARRQPLRPAAYWSIRSLEFLTAWWDTLHDTAPRLAPLLQPDAPASRLVSLTPRSIKDFSRQMGYSRQYVHRRLKAQWQRTPGVVLREARLREAQRLLQSTNLTVAAIAEKVGYSDATAFGRAFRTAYGQSPRSFRQAIR